MITHYDLFAGIGGFSIALDEVFYDQPIRHIFCEWESFPTQVLYKHWPQGEFYGDIKELIKCLESAQCANNLMCSHRLRRNENGGVVTVRPVKPNITESGEVKTPKSTERLGADGIKPSEQPLSNTMAEDVFAVENQSQLSLLSTTSTATAIKTETNTEQEAGILLQDEATQSPSSSSATTATWQNHGSKSAPTSQEQQNETKADIAELVAHTGSKRARLEEPNASRQGRQDTDSSQPTMVRQGNRTTNAEGSRPSFTIVTGGFPCQPFSAAGRRRGTSDDRYKWPEMFEVIRNVKPDWVIAENVRGLVTWNEGMVLEQVCSDLESEGYEVQPFIIPAVAVNAPHRRDRVWIIAHRQSNGTQVDSAAKLRHQA